MNEGSLFPRLRSQQIQTNTQYELGYVLNYIWGEPGFEEATAMVYWKAVKKSAGWTSGGRRSVLTRCLSNDVLKRRNTFVIVLIYYVAMIKDLVEHHEQPALDAELEEAYDCNNPRRSFHITEIDQLGITRRFPSLLFLLSSCCEVPLSLDTNELRAIDMKSWLEFINFHQRSLIEEESDGSIRGNGHHDATNNSGDNKDLIDSDDSVSEDGSCGIKPVHSPKDQPKSEETELSSEEKRVNLDSNGKGSCDINQVCQPKSEQTEPSTREEVSQYPLDEATVHDFITDEVERTLLPSSKSEEDLHRLIQNASPTSTEQDEAISKELFYHGVYQANIDSNGRGSCDIRPPNCSEADESNHSSNGLSQYNDDLISMDFIGCIPIDSMDTDPESSTHNMDYISNEVRTVLQEFQESSEEEEISPMDIDPESSTDNMDHISNEARTVSHEFQESSEEEDISPSCDMSVQTTVTFNELQHMVSVMNFMAGGIHDKDFDPPSKPPSILQALAISRERKLAEEFQHAETLLSFARKAQGEELLQKIMCELSCEEESIVKNALDGVGESAVRQGTNIVQRSSMQTLKPEQKLNDEIISYFLQIVLARWEEMLCAKQSGTKRSLFLNSFFVQTMLDEKNNNPKLRGKYNYANVKSWSKGKDIFNSEYILVPVNIDNWHWTLMIIFMEEKVIRYYDSQTVCDQTKELWNRSRMTWLLQYLEDEFENNNTPTLDWFDRSEWTLMDCSMDTPKQTNGKFTNLTFTLCNIDFYSSSVDCILKILRRL